MSGPASTGDIGETNRPDTNQIKEGKPVYGAEKACGQRDGVDLRGEGPDGRIPDVRRARTDELSLSGPLRHDTDTRGLHIGQAEYSAVFFFNIFTACGLYLVLLAVTPFLASYYNAPVMRTLAPVLFLLVPVNSFSKLQMTFLTRSF